jgi:hypothetical protein
MQQSQDRSADIASENFIDICIEDAKIEGFLEEGSTKLPLTFFLVKLLSEFRNQEVSQAISQNRNFAGAYTDNPSPI